MKRRHFVTKVSSLGAGLFLGNGLQGHSAEDFVAAKMKDLPSCARMNDVVWKKLRKFFLLPDDYHYFNSGGLGASPYMVQQTIQKASALENRQPNPGYNGCDWDRVKGKCAELLGACKEEIALIGTSTEGINIILNGLPLAKGDEVIASTHEHVALGIPLIHKMQRQGIVVRLFHPDLNRAAGNVERIEALITPRTRLIFTSHITCTTGQVMPVHAIGRLARANGVWFALDGAQSAGQRNLDIKAIGADFYTFSGHKWLLGPNRTGVLFVRNDLMELVTPSVVGAYSDSCIDFQNLKLTLHPTARRFEYGTQNEALFMGLECALDFRNCVNVNAIESYIRELAEFFYKELEKRPKLQILSPAQADARSAMITFKLKDKPCGNLTQKLEESGFRVRHVSEDNLDGVRVSFHLYNHKEEIEKLLHRLDQLTA